MRYRLTPIHCRSWLLNVLKDVLARARIVTLDSTGLAVEDLALCALMLERAH